MKLYLNLIVILCYVAAVAQCDDTCDFVPIVVDEGLAKIENNFEEMKKKNIDPFLEAIANTTAPLVEFNDKIKDIVKDYMNQSCVMESINALDTSVKKGLEKADAMYKPESVRANADLVLKDYNKVIADEVEKQTKILHAYVIAHNINLTCYLEVFREGFRNVTYLFDNVIPDYLNNFATEVAGKLFETTQKMKDWTASVNAGVEDCKTKPFTPFCVAAYLSDNTPKLVQETNLGGLLEDTKVNFSNGLDGEKMNAIQIIGQTFQKIFNAILKC